MEKYIPTLKQIARSAGYYAYKQFSSGGDSWHWTDGHSWSKESSSGKFASEEDAYKDCCIKAGLVTVEEFY